MSEQDSGNFIDGVDALRKDVEKNREKLFSSVRPYIMIKRLRVPYSKKWKEIIVRIIPALYSFGGH